MKRNTVVDWAFAHPFLMVLVTWMAFTTLDFAVGRLTAKSLPVPPEPLITPPITEDA